jgi:CRP-like cAMP-binding protein
VADMPEIAPAPRGKGPSRRTSVSAESMDPNKMKGAKVADIAKTPEVAAELNRIVGKSPLLRALDAEQKDKIVRAFDGPKTVAPGENIITQGEIGDTFYLIEDGLVDVYIKKGGGDEIKVHTYKPGDAFGELAIMYNAPRAATCRAQSEAKVWALDRTSFKVIVVAAAMIKRELYQGFLQKVPILATCNEMEIMTLADSLAEEKVRVLSLSLSFSVDTLALTHFSPFSSSPTTLVRGRGCHLHSGRGGQLLLHHQGGRGLVHRRRRHGRVQGGGLLDRGQLLWRDCPHDGQAPSSDGNGQGQLDSSGAGPGNVYARAGQYGGHHEEKHGGVHQVRSADHLGASWAVFLGRGSRFPPFGSFCVWAWGPLP